jgi:hypothetical protein
MKSQLKTPLTTEEVILTSKIINEQILTKSKITFKNFILPIDLNEVPKEVVFKNKFDKFECESFVCFSINMLQTKYNNGSDAWTKENFNRRKRFSGIWHV